VAVLALAAAGTALASAASVVQTRSASFDGVRAMLAYRQAPSAQPGYLFTRLMIYRRGALAFDGSPPAGYNATYLTEISPASDVLQVRELDRDNEPEVIVQMYTGGAHCCIRTLIYGYVAAKRTYLPLETDWQNSGFALKELEAGGSWPEFLSEDNAFAYAFASYAGSGMPLLIFRYRSGALLDMTRCYPQRIAAQANGFWSSALEQKRDPNGEPNGVLAGWVADQYNLGAGPAAWAQLKQFPSADAKFTASLRDLLKKNGYLRATAPGCAE